MEQPDDESTGGRTADDPWSEAGEKWSSVSEALRARYRQVAGEDGPSEDDVRGALETLGEAARTVAESFGAAMRDPEVRDQVKGAAASFVSAMGETLSQLGDELTRVRSRDGDTAAEGVAQEEE